MSYLGRQADIATGNKVVENFVDGVDYTSGTSTQITLAQVPSTENNLEVYFDAATQHHTTYVISGNDIIFDDILTIFASKCNLECIMFVISFVNDDNLIIEYKLYK